MILADTSVWVEHLRSSNRILSEYLDQGLILMHPFVIAELALGSLHNRDQILHLFDQLPQAPMANMDEVRHLIETRPLYALGIGLVDAHLLASVFINPATKLWTKDRRLRKVAEALGAHISVQ